MCKLRNEVVVWNEVVMKHVTIYIVVYSLILFVSFTIIKPILGFKKIRFTL